MSSGDAQNPGHVPASSKYGGSPSGARMQHVFPKQSSLVNWLAHEKPVPLAQTAPTPVQCSLAPVPASHANVRPNAIIISQRIIDR